LRYYSCFASVGPWASGGSFRFESVARDIATPDVFRLRSPFSVRLRRDDSSAQRTAGLLYIRSLFRGPLVLDFPKHSVLPLRFLIRPRFILVVKEIHRLHRVHSGRTRAATCEENFRDQVRGTTVCVTNNQLLVFLTMFLREAISGQIGNASPVSTESR